MTNQADGERCHTVSVLQAHWLSPRKPTSSALTSNSGGTPARAAARARGCEKPPQHTRTPTQTPLSLCKRIGACVRAAAAAAAAALAQGISVKGDSVHRRWEPRRMGKKKKRFERKNGKLISMFLGQLRIHGRHLARPISTSVAAMVIKARQRERFHLRWSIPRKQQPWLSGERRELATAAPAASRPSA